MRRILALALVLSGAATASAQVRPRVGPNPRIQVAPTRHPDVPLLVGTNSGHALAVQDMDGGGGEMLASGFSIGPQSVAPRLGMMEPQHRLTSLIPGNMPMARVLLPEPGWRAFGAGVLTGYTFDPTGRVLYGVNCQAGTVVRFDTQTGETASIGSPGTGLGQLECPEKVAVGRDGRIYVADRHRIVRMNDISGDGWTSFGGHGDGVGRFNYIVGIAVDSHDRIYVSDFFNERIVRIDDMTGAGWTTYREAIRRPAGIAVDQFDRIYLALPTENHVLRIDDMTGAGIKRLYLSRVAAAGSARGPAVVVPMRRGPAGGVIR
jgi:hypothetical protein